MTDMKWIPITTRKTTREENEKLAEKYGFDPEELDGSWSYTCPLPEDGQEVLVTTRVWGYVVIDTFYINEDGTPYFEDHDDEDDLLAWMPLPEPYKDPLDHSDEPVRCKAEGCSTEGCKHCENYEPIELGGDS